jgi:hypothetical protein
VFQHAVPEGKGLHNSPVRVDVRSSMP